MEEVSSLNIDDCQDILNIYAHQTEDDTIFYRVQWSNRSCEWVDGASLFNPKYQKYLVRYWNSKPVCLIDSSTQTDPVKIFDFSITQENIKKWTSSFRTFYDGDKGNLSTAREEDLSGLIPFNVVSINVIENQAMVQFSEGATPVEMPLDRLLMLSPQLVAQYFVNAEMSQE
ncbi:hypothetical protein TRFO_07768 [Tritrichomonas foetus]|uniref:Chromo domain-containing protein n=1 Tax=Tritrichomonas foetus TaxID=1144522 RepID=A0A1J4JTG4_9EUKA|nr:hypothetical protein TRFO_07768 [Tritrichomonas foetus]|eukprot:OHT00788.1 hypothetical protein TRFO_07768 [Tritrichomonas foetus]